MKALLLLAAIAACDPLDTAPTTDPATCEGCHPDQTREWASSMHAYASEDPVFVAMNRRGQRETSGQLAQFCTRCHAPFADSATLDDVPRERRGVGCVACHKVEWVEAPHNAAIRWDLYGPMRGALHAPVDNPAHESRYSELVDANRTESSSVCGGCHDVVTPGGLAIENTFAEWNASVFAKRLSCSGCHMFPTAPRRHDHSFPGIDVATTPWPGIPEQQRLIARDLRAALITKLCVQPAGGGVEVAVTLDNAQVGHAFPSGTTHARRLRAELTTEPPQNPQSWVLGSKFFRDGEEVQFAWEVDAIESELLMPTTTLDPLAPGYYHARTRTFVIYGQPEVIRLSVHEQPIGIDILESLVASGDLDPAVIDASVTHTLDGAAREWHAADGYGCVP